MKKKAQLQIQFNWIYVAVVGVVFLLLFMSISSTIRKNSEKKLASDTIDYFDQIFINLQASDNTENNIMLPGMEIEVAVDKDNCNFYTVQGSGLEGRSIEFTSVFSPEIISREVLAYTLGWDMPFTTSYFLFLTSPEIAYVSVGEQIKLPKHLTSYKVGSSSQFLNENYRSIRFYSTSGDPGSYSLHGSVAAMADEHVTAVFLAAGTVKFYRKAGNSFELQGQSSYSDYETSLAAIYSDNKDSYECNLRKSLKRLNRISSILNSRSQLIKPHSDCSASLYDDASSLLSQIESKTDTAQTASLTSIQGLAANLEEINSELNRKACPTIY